jgi:hypothetical protein
MDGIHVGDLSRADDAAHLEVTLRARIRANADGLIREMDVHGVSVCLRINGDGFDIEFLARTDDPEGNFATVGYEDFFEHERDGGIITGFRAVFCGQCPQCPAFRFKP